MLCSVADDGILESEGQCPDFSGEESQVLQKKSNLSEVHAPPVPSAAMYTTVMGFNWNRAGSEREGGGADGPARRRSEKAMMRRIGDVMSP